MTDNQTKLKLPCPRCGSSNTIRAGKNYQNKRQKMLCKDCSHYFQDGSIDKNEREPQKNIGDSHE